MIVEVVGGAEEHPEARVVDVDNLTRMHLALGEVTDEEASEVLELAGLGRIQATAPDWADRWEALVAGARAAGSMSEDGDSIQVRVESAAGA
jgi:hypothetical protein